MKRVFSTYNQVLLHHSRNLLEAEETRAWLRLAGFRLGDFRTKPPDA